MYWEYGIFWIFTLFHPFLPFCTHFLLISTTSTVFLRRFLPTMGTLRRQGRCSQSAQLWGFNLPVLLRKPGQLSLTFWCY